MFNKIILLVMGSYCIVGSVYASSDIYQCKNSNGEISFQQEPCKVDETSVKIKNLSGQASGSSKKGILKPDDMKLDSILEVLFKTNLDGNMRLNEKFGGSGYTEWIDQLSEFNATDVLAAVEKLWTIQVAQPRRNGSYMWTTLAENTEKGQANNVVNISYSRNEIHHFQIYKSATFDESSVGPFVSWHGSRRNGRKK